MILEPMDFFTINGVPETAENDRTGELTPPGIIFFVLLNSLRDLALCIYYFLKFFYCFFYSVFILIKYTIANSNHIRTILHR